jgi:hypothetical protein
MSSSRGPHYSISRGHDLATGLKAWLRFSQRYQSLIVPVALDLSSKVLLITMVGPFFVFFSAPNFSRRKTERHAKSATSAYPPAGSYTKKTTN